MKIRYKITVLSALFVTSIIVLVPFVYDWPSEPTCEESMHESILLYYKFEKTKESKYNDTEEMGNIANRHEQIKKTAIKNDCIEIIENRDGMTYWPDAEKKILRYWKNHEGGWNPKLDVALEKLMASDLPLVISGHMGNGLMLKWKASEMIDDPDAVIRAVIGEDIPYELSFGEYGHCTGECPDSDN